MKGLLIKDMELTLVNKRMMWILLFVGLFLLISGKEENFIFAISYLTLMCGMMAVTTLSYDEFDHSNAFLMTMPATRRLYAVEKYVFLFLSMLAGWIVSAGLGTILKIMAGNEVVWAEWWMVCVGILLPLIMILLIMLPIQMKFGSDHGRMVLMGFGVAVIIVVFMGNKIMKGLNIDIETVVNNVNNWLMQTNIIGLALGGILLVVLTTAVSMYFGIRIMEKKQF